MTDRKIKPSGGSLRQDKIDVVRQWHKPRGMTVISLVNSYRVLDVATNILIQYGKADRVFQERIRIHGKRTEIPFEKAAPILEEAADITREAAYLIIRFSKLTETLSAMVNFKYYPPTKRLKRLIEMIEDDEVQLWKTQQNGSDFSLSGNARS